MTNNSIDQASSIIDLNNNCGDCEEMAIDIKQVYFEYHKSNPVLNDVNLKIPKGLLGYFQLKFTNILIKVKYLHYWDPMGRERQLLCVPY